MLDHTRITHTLEKINMYFTVFAMSTVAHYGITVINGMDSED